MEQRAWGMEHGGKDSWQEAANSRQQVEVRDQMSEVRFKVDL